MIGGCCNRLPLQMDNFNILRWNVQVLNYKARRDVVCTLVSDRDASVICLLEMKLDDVSPFLVNKLCGPLIFDYSCLSSTNTRGGVIVITRLSFTLTAIQVSRFSVHIQVSSPNESSFFLSNVYGPNDDCRVGHCPCPDAWAMAHHRGL